MAHILAVDDALTIRKVVEAILVEEGHTVDVAEDGVAALNMARKTDYDIVLSDVNMPNMGGISLLNKLRGMEQYKSTPILMITTEGAGYKKDKAKATGASGWLEKPFDPPRLANAVESLLEKYAAV